MELSFEMDGEKVRHVSGFFGNGDFSLTPGSSQAPSFVESDSATSRKLMEVIKEAPQKSTSHKRADTFGG